MAAGYTHWHPNHWLEDYHWLRGHWRAMDLPAFAIYDATSSPRVFVREVDYTASLTTGNCHSDIITGMLPEGEYTLAITYIDQYGSESNVTSINVPFDASGNVRTEFMVPFRAKATAIAAGNVNFQWFIQNLNTFQVRPTEYEIAEADDLGTVLATISDTGANNYTTTVGPFVHGSTVELRVRSSDGAGTYSDWVAANDVTADSEAPDPPTIVT